MRHAMRAAPRGGVRCAARRVSQPQRMKSVTENKPGSRRQPFVKIASAAISVREFHIWNATGRNPRVDFDISIMAASFIVF